MNHFYEDNLLAIGKTPLVRINKLTNNHCAKLFAKIEGRNPSYSVKCRVAVSMIWAAEKNGILKQGSQKVTIVEPTSGNTGIGLAFACAARGYPLTLIMPDSMSIERRKMLAAFGAKLILTDSSKGMKLAIEEAEKIVASDSQRYYSPRQFSNPANPEIHFKTTALEIFEALNGKVDILVAGVGTGGTITGIARFLKLTKGLNTQIVAVEPEKSAVLTATKAGKPSVTGSHKIQGIGAGFVPEILDLNIIDSVETVSDEAAFEFARSLHTKEGITCGISSGAAMAAAAKLAQKPENTNKNIVVIFPDSGERYLSTALFHSS